jgi:predicted Zn-dependent protease
MHEPAVCGNVRDTITHEVGHCIGFFGHENDGSLMSESVTSSREISNRAQNMLDSLYSMPPKSSISQATSVTD